LVLVFIFLKCMIPIMIMATMIMDVIIFFIFFTLSSFKDMSL
jgi:hypothetical protein